MSRYIAKCDWNGLRLSLGPTASHQVIRTKSSGCHSWTRSQSMRAQMALNFFMSKIWAPDMTPAEIAHQNPQFICSESTIIKARHKPFGEGLNIPIEGSINRISLKPMTNGLHIDLAICKRLLLQIDQVAEAEVIHERHKCIITRRGTLVL